jgi:hypothetical protein
MSISIPVIHHKRIELERLVEAGAGGYEARVVPSLIREFVTGGSVRRQIRVI